MRSLLLLGFCLMATTAFSQVSSPRLRHTINDYWRYAPGLLEGAEAVDYDDGVWTLVDLPHTWNAEDAFDKTEGYRRGVGWYRKQLSLNPALRGKRLFLYFEGANQVADVYVNGQHAGRHVGGYTAFVFDVTDLVTFEEPNLVAVRVDNGHDDNIPPLNADFTFYGGIYRDVWLLATAPVHLDVLDHASPGVFIDTPTVSETTATVRVRGSLVNETAEAKRVAVVNRIVDADHEEVAVLRSEVEVAPGEKASFEHVSGEIATPHLWSPGDPYLYRVDTEVVDGDVPVDRISNPLGFRWFAVDGQEGFFLNGEPLPLYGTNRHQDAPGYGNAVPDALHRRDVRLVKENGFNFLRLAHYPQDPAVLDAADRLGLILWEEIPIVNIITMSEAFGDHSERMLVEMIRQHYNHPSVVMWGYMNEVMLREPRPIPEGYYEAVLALARRLEDRVHQEDPSRLTATAQSHGEIYNGKGISDLPDVLGMNLYFGWYYQELETLGAFLDDLHAAHPERPLMISEYGAGSDERVHTLTPRAFDFSSEHAQRFHQADFRQIRDRPYLAGSAVWNQFDFGSAGRQDTKNAINQKGLYLFDRTPKDVAFYYKAMLLGEPVLHVAREWSVRAGSRPDDRTQPVWVYTNLDTVALTLNGRPLGVQPVANGTARWMVPFAPGRNVLEAQSTYDGQVVRDRVTMRYDDRTAFFDDPAADASVMAVNAGAHYQFVDQGEVVWEADQGYEAGRWGAVGGQARRTHHRIPGTVDDPLYQATRDSVQAYRFDVPDGVYEVQLGVVEVQHEAPGRRVFSVSVNGQLVFADLDLAAQYGRYVAVERKTEVQATDGQGVTVRFDAAIGTSTISGLRLRRLQ